MRQHHVIVTFGQNADFDFQFAAAPTPQDASAARAWFDREFVALEADVASPIGKVLNADRVLAVAKYAGARRFREDRVWADAYARHAAALLGRDLIKVDVPNYTLGY